MLPILTKVFYSTDRLTYLKSITKISSFKFRNYRSAGGSHYKLGFGYYQLGFITIYQKIILDENFKIKPIENIGASAYGPLTDYYN